MARVPPLRSQGNKTGPLILSTPFHRFPVGVPQGSPMSLGAAFLAQLNECVCLQRPPARLKVSQRGEKKAKVCAVSPCLHNMFLTSFSLSLFLFRGLLLVCQLVCCECEKPAKRLLLLFQLCHIKKSRLLLRRVCCSR